jgi:SAM-dependent methyltransferase
VTREHGAVPINPTAAGGFSSAAATYARIRPTYARAAIGALKDLCGRDARVLDVAAGTGILTGQLVRAGLRTTAVEPLAPMARQLRLALPAVPLVLAAAESLPLLDGVADLCTVGQGFHWFDAPAALSEAARVLSEDGVLALLWNVRDESVAWVAEITQLVEERTGGRPYDDHRERPWAEVVATSGRFDGLVEERYPNPVPTDVGGVLERIRSTSFVATLDEGPREDLLAEAARRLASHDDLAGTFDYPHHTVLHWCRRR